MGLGLFGPGQLVGGPAPIGNPGQLSGGPAVLHGHQMMTPGQNPVAQQTQQMAANPIYGQTSPFQPPMTNPNPNPNVGIGFGPAPIQQGPGQLVGGPAPAQGQLARFARPGLDQGNPQFRGNPGQPVFGMPPPYFGQPVFGMPARPNIGQPVAGPVAPFGPGAQISRPSRSNSYGGKGFAADYGTMM